MQLARLQAEPQWIRHDLQRIKILLQVTLTLVPLRTGGLNLRRCHLHCKIERTSWSRCQTHSQVVLSRRS